MSKVINLEKIRLSMQDHDELIVTAIEKSAEQINLHARLLGDVNKRLLSLENIIETIDQELEDYR